LEIADWLHGLSLERYADTFRDNAIGVAVLPELSEFVALRGGAAENIAEPVPGSAPIPRWRTNPAPKGP
jgi:SAM domain (Sterile alpha motif)